MLNVPKVGQKTDASPAAIAAATGEPPAPPPLPNTIRLKKPIRTHSGETRELKFRNPVAADYMEVGSLPFDIRGDEENRRVVMDFKSAGRWISRLTGIDEILIGQLDRDDWLEATGMLNMILMGAGVDDLGNSGG